MNGLELDRKITCYFSKGKHSEPNFSFDDFNQCLTKLGANIRLCDYGETDVTFWLVLERV